MFSFNSGQRPPKLGEVYQWWSFEPQGKLVLEFLSSLEKITPSLDDTPLGELQIPDSGPVENINPDHAPEDRFMDGDNDFLLDFDFPLHLSDVHGQRESKGLPPDFVGNLCLNRIFTEPWEAADLKHALTGLDYLSNLEGTRRTALREAAQRLGINEHTWHDVLFDNREASAWISSIQQQENQIEQYYSTLFVDLRVWTMLKELRAEPFYKPNVIAMLNTLFPPVIKELPSVRISKKVLHKYRNTFYRHIVAVEKYGQYALEGFIEKLARPGTAHTWSNTRQNLKEYVKLADSMIKQATAVYGVTFFKNLQEDEKFLRSRGNSAATELSTPISLNSTASASYEELKRMSTTSGPRKDALENKSGSIKSGSSGSNAQAQKYFPIPRHRITGRPLNVQRLSQADDVDALFSGSLPSPWYASPRRPSSASGQSGSDDSPFGARPPSNSLSRPESPATEEPRLHKRSSSAAKRISYDFHNALPATPELPSPSPNKGKTVAFTTATTYIPSEESVVPRGPNVTSVPKAKKSGFSFFRRKKKSSDIPTSVSTERIVQINEAASEVSLRTRKTSDYHPQHAPVPRASDRLAVKKKSSFGFLQGNKSSSNVRHISDSNSERTVTDVFTQQKLKLKTKASLDSLFAAKVRTSQQNYETGNDRTSSTSYEEKQPRRGYTLRKARSQNSVRSNGSVKSTDGDMRTPRSSRSTVFDEDRIITSSDIKEPFPFGSFVPPQTPAMLLEDSEELRYIEAIRQTLIDKARKERMAKWEQSQEFKRKLEAAQEKRRLTRVETEREAQEFKTPKRDPRAAERNNRREIEYEREKAIRTPARPDPKTPTSPVYNTPSPRTHRITNPQPYTPGTSPEAHSSPISPVQSSGKPPKTPLKARIIKELASAYSPN